MIGYAADADARLLTAFRLMNELGVPQENLSKGWENLFFAKLAPDVVNLQDFYHCASRHRARILDGSQVMKVGRHKISGANLGVCFVFEI